MDWLQQLVDVIVWATPAAVVVAMFGPPAWQRRLVPVLALLIFFLTVGAVYRFWPRRNR